MTMTAHDSVIAYNKARAHKDEAHDEQEYLHILLGFTHSPRELIARSTIW